MRGAGAKLIGYTESMGFYSNYRLRRLGLDGVFHEVFSPQDHDIPKNMSIEAIRKYPAEHYDLKFTTHRYAPKGSLKPDPAVLRAIINQVGNPTGVVLNGHLLSRSKYFSPRFSCLPKSVSLGGPR